MMRLRDLGLRTKIVVSVVVPLLAAYAVALVAIYGYRSVRSLLADVHSRTEILFLAGEIEESAREAAATARTVALEQRVPEQTREKAFAQASEKFAAIKGMLKPGSEERKLVAQAEESLRAWLGKKGEKTGAQEHVNEFGNLMAQFTERVKRLIVNDMASAAKLDKAVSWTLVALGGLTVLIAILAIYLLSKGVAGPIKSLIAAAEAGGRGDLIASLRRDRSDEIGQLVRSLNDLVSSLVSHSAQLAEGVNVLAESGGHIASAASQLFAGASQTASAVSETTSIVHQMEQTAKVVNDTARNVADRSRRSDEVAAAGKRATADNVEQMSLIQGKMELVGEAVVALSNKTRDIEEIIVAVQDLAEQSNLLAVNASIEAARAGEQGRGFAVVAGEIKTLADQSREATDRVTKILQEIRASVSSVVMATEEGGKAVQVGVEQTNAARKAIEDLADSIMEFSQAAGVIFSSSEQQFSRVERVSGAMREVEDAMKKSVDGTTLLTDEAKRLEELGMTLKDLVSRDKGRGKRV